MATKPKKVDDSYSVLPSEFESPNPHMESILHGLYWGDAANIVNELEKVRWMTEDQAAAFAMYFRSTPFDGEQHFNFFEFRRSKNGRGNKVNTLKKDASLTRGRYLHELLLKHQKAGQKIKHKTLFDDALKNWPKHLGVPLSAHTLRNDFAAYRRLIEQNSAPKKPTKTA